jgi:hypothetical protein
MIFSGVLRTRKERAGNLWNKNTAYIRPTFHATMARDLFFQIPHIIHFNDKTTSNQWRSTDKSAQIWLYLKASSADFQWHTYQLNI